MIIEKATELGMALSNSDEFRRLQAAKAAMNADKHVNELMKLSLIHISEPTRH